MLDTFIFQANAVGKTHVCHVRHTDFIHWSECRLSGV
jgi:hypothetical protein